MKNVKVTYQLIGSFIVILLLTVLLGGEGIKLLTAANQDYGSLYYAYGESLGQLGEFSADFQKVKVDIRNLLYRCDTQEEINQEIENLISDQKETEEHAQNFKKYLVEEKFLTMFDSAYQSWQSYSAAVDEVISLVKAGKMSEAETVLSGEGSKIASNTSSDLTKLSEEIIAAGQSYKEQMNLHLKRNIYLEAGIVGIVFILVVLISIFLTSAISKPMKKLTEISERLAKGDLNVTAVQENNNEFGKLTGNFAAMIQTMKEQAAVLGEIEKGNYDITIKPRSEADVLGKSMLSFLQKNSQTIQRIRNATYQVSAGSEQVSMASQSIAQGATEQASAIEEITVSVASIADRTKVNAENINIANNLVTNAKTEAVVASEQMEEMISAMKEINDSSENISKIIKVIDDIAFQTNILALNAAVEAARAGVHGKGFAVVAEEVRNLAEKSAAAASETAEMIEDSIKKVETGSKFAENTERALSSIVESIDKIVDIAGGIGKASGEQATVIAQVDQAISQVSEVVQTNSATSEQCATASEELSNQALRLKEMIAQFRLKENNSFEHHDQKEENEGYVHSDRTPDYISLEEGFGKY